MPVIVNQRGVGSSMNGECLGFAELAETYFKWRSIYPKSPGLADCTDLMKTTRGEKYLGKIMDLSSQFSQQNGPPPMFYGKSMRDPDGFSADIVDKLKSSGSPQGLTLKSQGDGINHRVTVYGARLITTPAGPRWELRIADSNMYGRGNVDNVTVVYEPGANGAPGSWVERIDGKPVGNWGGISKVPPIKNSADTYAKLVLRGMQGKPVNELRAELDIPEIPNVGRSLGHSGSVSVVQTKPGGIFIHFDPAIFATASPTEIEDLNHRISVQLGRGPGSAILTLKPRDERFVLVPLRALDSMNTLGDLTRVRGFVRSRSGEIAIVGIVQNGRPRIPLDDLTVALKTIFQENLTPFVSLDPDPANPLGDQRARIGQISQSQRKSSFVLAMLEADFLMKRINCGDLASGIPGFKSWFDILNETPPTKSNVLSRMWLSPLQGAIADVSRFEGDGATAVVFENPVQVQGEQMMVEGGSIVGLGKVPADVQSASDNFTTYYDRLADRFPQFARLQAVLDVSKLARAFHAFNVTSPELTRLANRKTTELDVPISYPAVSPRAIESAHIWISGGVKIDGRFNRSEAISAPYLQPLVGGKDFSSVEVPKTIDVPAESVESFETQSALMMAQSCLREGAAEEALEIVDGVLSSEAGNLAAMILRAQSLLALGKNREAAEALSPLAAADATCLAYRALARARAGQVDAATLDIVAARRAYPESDEILSLAVTVFVKSNDLARAEAELETLQIRSPLNPALGPERALVANLRAFSPRERVERLAMLSQLPPDVERSLSTAASSIAEPEKAIEALQYVLMNGMGLPEKLEVPYRAKIMLMLAYAFKAKDMPNAAADCKQLAGWLHEELVRQFPARGLPDLMRASISQACGEGSAATAAYFQSAIDKGLVGDPTVLEMASFLGSNSILLAQGIHLWAAESLSSGQASDLLDKLTAAADANVKPFLEAISREKSFNLPLFMKNGMNNLSFEQKRSALASLLKIAAERPTQYEPACFDLEAYVLMWVLALKTQMPLPNDFEKTFAEAVEIDKKGIRTPAMVDLASNLLSRAWMMLFPYEMQAAFGSDARADSKLDQAGRSISVLLTKSVSLAEAKRVLTANLPIMQTAFTRVRDNMARRWTEIESTSGRTTRLAGELQAAIVQEFGTNQNPFQGRLPANRAIATLPEFKNFTNLMTRLLDHPFTRKSVRQVWSELLVAAAGERLMPALVGYCKGLMDMADAHMIPFVKNTSEVKKLVQSWSLEAKARS